MSTSKGIAQPRSWSARIVLALACALFLWAASGPLLLFARHSQAVVSFPYPIDYGEGPILDQALRLASFENIYRRDLSTPPFTISNYPPVFVAAHVPFVWGWGPAFWYGRAISLAAALATALFVSLTIYTLSRNWLGAAAGGLALLCVPYILHWGALDRVDSLALGLSWAGLWAVSRWPASSKAFVACAILLTAAIFTRQSYALAAPLAAFVWLWSQQSMRRAFELAGVVAGLSLVLLGLLQLVTGGGFYFNIVTANVNPFYWNSVWDKAGEIWAYLPQLVLGAAFFLLAAVWWRVRAWWLVAPYLVGATISAATIGKAGSNVNYLFELSAALALAAGALVAWPRGPWLRAALLLLLAFQVAIMGRWSEQDYYNRAMGKVRERAEIEWLMGFVREAKGPVLTDEYMGLVPLAGKRLPIQPFEMKQLADAGLWDESVFVASLARREYELVLIYHLPGDFPLHRDRWTVRQLNAIDTYYNQETILADTWLYRP